MSDWEDFCEANGVANDEFAYDKLSAIYHDDYDEDKRKNRSARFSKQRFDSFQKALAWSKSNPGKVIMPSPDGNGYVEK